MEARAHLSHARITPRKVKIVCDLIRGKDTKTAVAILMNTPNAAAELLLKLVNSAVANAENNHSMDPDNLYISETFANPGPTLKRGMARARGGYARILKRTSHITVVVKEKE
ncbi:MAG: 50S ribosomal protein L22 [Oscillospiraceae bacterium]|nr:50S ribosomal protein L22 [Oscillospiraceae bacterium]